MLGVTELGDVQAQFGRNQLIAMITAVITAVLLLTLFIALLTTKLEEVRQLAREQAAFLKARSCYELKQRQRQLPPPLNWIAVTLYALNFAPALPLRAPAHGVAQSPALAARRPRAPRRR